MQTGREWRTSEFIRIGIELNTKLSILTSKQDVTNIFKIKTEKEMVEFKAEGKKKIVDLLSWISF